MNGKVAVKRERRPTSENRRPFKIAAAVKRGKWPVGNYCQSLTLLPAPRRQIKIKEDLTEEEIAQLLMGFRCRVKDKSNGGVGELINETSTAWNH